MKKLSLKWKIYMIGYVPFFFFLATMISYPIFQNYQSYENSTSLHGKLSVIAAASDMVHETQKERGKSAGYMNGGATLEGLNQQRSINDQKITALRNILKEGYLGEKYQNDLITKLDEFRSLRELVDTKSAPAASIIKSYSSIIKHMLNIELDVANMSTNPLIATKLKGLRILEDAKESGGKLRAVMSVILGKNAPITNEQFENIVNLKAGVDEGVKSSGLSLDDKSKEYLSNFNDSKDWKKVNDIFKVILKNADKGEYNYNTTDFFATITSALNILGELVVHQKNTLLKDIESIHESASSKLWIFFIAITAILVSMFLTITVLANTLASKIKTIIESLKISSNEVSSSSEYIASTSKTLSEASGQHASSLQQVVSSIDEISAMVERNANAADQSTASSKKSKDDATVGKNNIDEMMNSMNEIAINNENIMKELENNNVEFETVTNVISGIGEKTKVINDIVFQTKLLSFNASVEAARAGEHGKGFSVVAEEIGNLAEMSGNAAREIFEMLESSIKQVNGIIANSKSKMTGIIDESKDKIDKGMKIANKCEEVFEEIYKGVISVNSMVQEISKASQEQAIGVREITNAMQQFDYVSLQNISEADNCSSIAEQLKKNSTALEWNLKDLICIVDGGCFAKNLNPSNATSVKKKSPANNVLKFENDKPNTETDMEPIPVVVNGRK